LTVVEQGETLHLSATMTMRTTLLALAIVACTAGAAFASRPLVALACGPSPLDVVCRLNANLKVRARVVTSNAPQMVLPQSGIVTSGAGTADIYFTRYATCEMESPTASGTRLVTRQPKAFLFTQNYGATLCLFFTGAQALIADRSKVRSSALSTNLQPFFVGVEAMSSFTQVRIDFIPHSSLSIAVRGGSALLHLPSDAAQPLGSGNETIFKLDGQEQIVSTDTHPAVFNSDESTIFDSQAAKMKKGR
jgi:hypothetical protein